MAEQSPILVTGAAGRVDAVGRTITELLVKQDKAVRAMARNEDEREEAPRRPTHDQRRLRCPRALLDFDFNSNG
jgi:hypothetical protein